jgi:hypothetical protein
MAQRPPSSPPAVELQQGLVAVAIGCLRSQPLPQAVADRDRLTIGLPRAATLSGCRHGQPVAIEHVADVEARYLARPAAARRQNFDVQRDRLADHSGDPSDDPRYRGVVEHDTVARSVRVRKRFEAASPRFGVGGNPRIEPGGEVHCRLDRFSQSVDRRGLDRAARHDFVAPHAKISRRRQCEDFRAQFAAQ